MAIAVINFRAPQVQRTIDHTVIVELWGGKVFKYFIALWPTLSTYDTPTAGGLKVYLTSLGYS